MVRDVVLRSFDTRPSPDFSPRLRDKIWEWPGDEATKLQLKLQCTNFQRYKYWVGGVGKVLFVQQKLTGWFLSTGDNTGVFLACKQNETGL